MMGTRKTYLLWGIFSTVGGWVISLIVTVGILTGFMIHLIFSHSLKWIPITMLVVLAVCIMAGVVLLMVDLTRK